jgi:hypothetical protein
MKRTVAALPLALALAACVDSPEVGQDESAVVAGDGEACPKLGCSSNSAYLGPTEFHELEETGFYPNAEGLYLKGLTKNGITWRPDVTGTVLTGHRWVWVGGLLVHQTLSGANLVNAELVVRNAAGTLEYRIRIINASQNQQFWQAPMTYVNTYELKWKQVVPAAPGDFVPVCQNPPNPETEDGPIQNTIESILFAGDRYDTDTLTVTASTPAEATTWFNIGCAGTVLAKLALNRHTDATKSAQVTTTRAQRQAMLKMYTSDVCGSGDALTVSGTPLRWWSATGLTSKVIPTTSREALWTDNGAICLDTHRLSGTADDMTKQIEDVCKRAERPVPPPCVNATGPWHFRTESQAQ